MSTTSLQNPFVDRDPFQDPSHVDIRSNADPEKARNVDHAGPLVRYSLEIATHVVYHFQVNTILAI
jgi:hypothetical protein